MPRAKRVEIAQNKRRRIADTSIERISSFDTLNKSTNTPISSTAKKIMRTLETFSSPLSVSSNKASKITYNLPSCKLQILLQRPSRISIYFVIFVITSRQFLRFYANLNEF